MNEKLKYAIWALDTVCYASAGRRRQILIDHVVNWKLSPDGWVAAALGCARDEDIPDIALEFFIADVKSGLFDLEKSDDNSNPDPLSTP